MDNAPSGFDQTLLALADPARRAILRRLSRGESRVTDLARPFAISLNAISKHIQMLERGRLVRRRRVGREHLLSLSPAPMRVAAAWIEAQRVRWTATLDELAALMRAEERASVRASRKKTAPR